MIVLANLATRVPLLLEKYGKKIPGLDRHYILSVNQLDPTEDQALYTEWLLRQDPKRLNAFMVSEEASESVRDMLGLFDRYKNTPQFKSAFSSDINRCTLMGLMAGLEGQRLQEIHAKPREREIKKRTKQGQQNSRLVYQEGEWKIYRVDVRDTSPEEAKEILCDISSGGGWCTKKADDARNYLSRGPIYMVFEGDKRQALYSPADKQFHDPYNDPLPKDSPIWKLWGRYLRGYTLRKPVSQHRRKQYDPFYVGDWWVHDDLHATPEEQETTLRHMGIKEDLGRIGARLYKRGFGQLAAVYSISKDKVVARGGQVLPEQGSEELYSELRKHFKEPPVIGSRALRVSRMLVVAGLNEKIPSDPKQMKLPFASSRFSVKTAAPRIDPEVQRTYWRLGQLVAQALRAATPENPQGDPGWNVSGAAVGGWKVTHPDLPIVKDDEGAVKDILLQLHVTQQAGKWDVVAQNKVVGPDQHASPRALVVAQENESPGPQWDLDEIAEAAANFFRAQKEDLAKAAQSVTPKGAPGSVPQGQSAQNAQAMMPGAAGPIMGSRMNRISRGIARV